MHVLDKSGNDLRGTHIEFQNCSTAKTLRERRTQFQFTLERGSILIMKIRAKITFVKVAIPLILCMKLSTTLSAMMMLRAHP